MRALAWGLVVWGGLAGCGFRPTAASDGGVVVDAPAGSDAAIDAGSGSGSGSGATARGAADLVLGAGRTTVGTITVDIQLGPGPQVTHTTAGAISIDGAPVIHP